MGLSIRAYARHRGVSHVAVKKAIDTGRITPLADGTLDAATADAQWAQNTAQPRRASAPNTAPTSAPTTSPTPQNTEVPVLSSGGGTSLLQARTVNEVLKAQTNKVRLAQIKGELVDRSQAIAHIFKLARAEREAWINWPNRVAPKLATELGVDEHTLFVALDLAVLAHLEELGELTPKVDA